MTDADVISIVRKIDWGNVENVVAVLYVFPASLLNLSHYSDANDALSLSQYFFAG